jgi:hypothetical protein
VIESPIAAMLLGSGGEAEAIDGANSAAAASATSDLRKCIATPSLVNAFYSFSARFSHHRSPDD